MTAPVPPLELKIVSRRTILKEVRDVYDTPYSIL